MELKDVEKLAKLARLQMSAEELAAVSGDLNSIVGYIDQISEVKVPAEIHSDLLLKNVMREDMNPHETGAYTAQILKEAPETKDGFLKVGQIL